MSTYNNPQPFLPSTTPAIASSIAPVIAAMTGPLDGGTRKASHLYRLGSAFSETMQAAGYEIGVEASIKLVQMRGIEVARAAHMGFEHALRHYFTDDTARAMAASTVSLLREEGIFAL